MIHVGKDNDQNNTKYQRIGIMGGTFDPIHIGHLFIAEEVLNEVGLDKILFIPVGIPPHKQESKVTDSQHRLTMAQIAVSGNANFQVSRIEVDREGPSYTVDTINHLKRIYNENTLFYFIIGTDAFFELDTWKNYKDLLKLVKLAVVTRVGYNNYALDEKIEDYKNRFLAEIIKVVIPKLEISSTDIKSRIRQGKTVKYIVPEGVEQYIKKHGLYKE